MAPPPEVISLNRDSQEFYLLQRIQEEVHRFAITFHRQIRSKTMFTSILDEVEGIGEKRKLTLLKHFGSVKKMKEASLNEIRNVGIPEKVAMALIEKLRE